MMRVAVFLLALALSACAALGVPTADTFNKKLISGYSTVQVVAKSASALRAAGKLSEVDRANVVDTNRQVLAGLDLARLTSQTDLAAAQSKLESTLLILTALESYLQTKQGAK